MLNRLLLVRHLKPQVFKFIRNCQQILGLSAKFAELPHDGKTFKKKFLSKDTSLVKILMKV